MASRIYLSFRKSWKAAIVLAAVLMAITLASPARADWMGTPNRTHSETVVVYDHAEWTLYDPDATSGCFRICTNVRTATCANYPTVSLQPLICCQGVPNPTFVAESASCSNIYRTETHTTSLPPATISGSLDCPTPGHGGWCLAQASLSLTANEPLSPTYSIEVIEGTINGVDFICPPGDSCTYPLGEGANDFAFWAHSSYGDTSDMGTASLMVDTRPPAIDGTLTGTPGAGGWYVSPVTLAASAVDPMPGSGLAGMTYALDGAAPAAFGGSLALTDGSHTVVLEALDAAGNASTATQSLQVDTLPPASAFTSGLPASGWVRGTLALDGTSADATSGMAGAEFSVDGVTWLPISGTTTWSYAWDTTTVADGAHTLLVRARDVAGNLESTASLSVNVDNTSPVLDVTFPAAFCPGCGEPLAIDLRIQDTASGIVAWTLRVDDTTILASGTAATVQTVTWDGVGVILGAHTLTLTASDLAGNTSMLNLVATLVAAPPPPAPPISVVTDPPASNPPAGLQPTGVPPIPAAAPGPAPATVAFKSDKVGIDLDASGMILPATGETDVSPAAATPGILWGTAAAAAIGAMAALAVEQRRKREEEEALQAAEVRAQAAALNRAAAVQQAAAAAGYMLDLQKRIAAAAAVAAEETVTNRTEDAVDPQLVEQYLDFLRTGKNPPPGMEDVTETERLALFQLTPGYLTYLAEQDALGVDQNQRIDQDISSGLYSLPGFSRDVTNFSRDLPDLVDEVGRPLSYLAFPDLDPNPTWATIQARMNYDDLIRGLISPAKYLELEQELASRPRPVLNATTLSQLDEGIRSNVSGIATGTSIVLQAGGLLTGDRNMASSGEVLSGAVDIAEGVHFFNNTQYIAQITNTSWAGGFTIFGGVMGAAQTGISTYRLLEDESLNPIESGSWNNDTWVERVGVAASGIGGAFLAVGTICAFVPGLQPAAAILIPAGSALMGAGSIMQNWGWITDTAENISDSVQSWLSQPASTPSSQASPIPTPSAPTQSVTPTPGASSPTATPQLPTQAIPQELPPPIPTPPATQTSVGADATVPSSGFTATPAPSYTLTSTPAPSPTSTPTPTPPSSGE